MLLFSSVWLKFAMTLKARYSGTTHSTSTLYLTHNSQFYEIHSNSIYIQLRDIAPKCDMMSYKQTFQALKQKVCIIRVSKL